MSTRVSHPPTRSHHKSTPTQVANRGGVNINGKNTGAINTGKQYTFNVGNTTQSSLFGNNSAGGNFSTVSGFGNTAGNLAGGLAALPFQLVGGLFSGFAQALQQPSAPPPPVSSDTNTTVAKVGGDNNGVIGNGNIVIS